MKIEYRLGRVMCKTGMMPVSEGIITDPKQIENAKEALGLYRSYLGGTEWISDDTGGLVPTEQKADDILGYLRERFDGSLSYAGDKPLDCQHGKIFFRKIAQLELTAEQDQEVNTGIASILECNPEDVLRLHFGWV